MPYLDDVEISCGIRQLHGLCANSNRFDPNDKIPPKDVLIRAFVDGGNDPFANGLPIKASEIKFGIVIFSDSSRRGNGKRLADFIEEQKLGTVDASKVVQNPNTRRNIQMWTWYLDREALVSWFKKNAKKEFTPTTWSYSYYPTING